jgi:hypothetical protein
MNKYTVGDIRSALEGLPDDMPFMIVSAEKGGTVKWEWTIITSHTDQDSGVQNFVILAY